MELPSFSYRPLRASLTRWPEPGHDTALNFRADLPDPLYAANDLDAAQAAPTPVPPPEAQPRRRASVEAARHTVLRRLAPALKHDMVVNLQAVSMMAEMLGARLERGGPESADLQANIAKLNRLAREAVTTCLKVSSWIDPGEDDTVALHEGVQECVSLMAGGLNFRGFALVSEVPTSEFEVSRGGLRTLLAASLITLADTAPAAGELQVRAELSGTHALLTVTCVPEGDEAQRPPVDPAAPRIDWNDVQALAASEQVELFRTGNQVTMRLPRAVASSPLRMAPI
jgi:hypothetical protein